MAWMLGRIHHSFLHRPPRPRTRGPSHRTRPALHARDNCGDERSSDAAGLAAGALAKSRGQHDELIFINGGFNSIVPARDVVTARSRVQPHGWASRAFGD